MTPAELAESFTIFAKYQTAGEAIVAEHDEIWAGPDPAVMSAEDRATIERLGWDISDFDSWHMFV